MFRWEKGQNRKEDEKTRILSFSHAVSTVSFEQLVERGPVSFTLPSVFPTPLLLPRSCLASRGIESAPFPRTEPLSFASRRKPGRRTGDQAETHGNKHQEGEDRIGAGGGE